jgi:uncharacterized protein involved in exopolysaccharide biosynthesis
MQVNLEGQALNTVDTLQLTTFADQYVGTLQRNVLVPKNMLSWVKELKVYPDLAQEKDSELVRQMSENIRISFVTTGVLEPRSGKELELITGFTASFDHPDPEIAHRVAETISDAFLQEDRRVGLAKSEPVLGFLEQQIATRLSEITDLEAAIAKFKEKNAGRLPEMMALNMSLLDRYERELDATKTDIRSLEEDRIYRKRQLDEIIAKSTVASQLAELQGQYVEMLSKYGSDHPDLIRTKRQIDSLTGGQLDGETAEIAKLQSELAELRQRYSDEHPDIIRIQRQVDKLRSEQQSTIADMTGGTEGDSQYLNLKADINAIDVKLASARSRQAELRSKINDVETKIAQMPEVERQYMALQRDLESTRQAYDKLRQDADQTRGIIDVEKELGARLIEVRQPWVPDKPASPPRLAIMILGAFLAVTLGGMAAIATEGLDSTVRGSRDIQSIFHAKPLVSIPVIQNSVVRTEKRRRAIFVALSFILLTAVVFSISGISRFAELF